MDNVNSTSVRNEYKVRVLNDYVMPSMRYILSVHNLTDTQLEEMNATQTRYLRAWLNLPPCSTNAMLYGKEGLNLTQVSELYFECRTMSYASSVIKGDHRVVHSLQSKLDRESKWSRKMQRNGLVASSNIVHEHLSENWQTSKKEIKKSLKEKVMQKWRDHIEPLVKQGNMLKLAQQEGSDIDWLSKKYNLPRGLLSFGVRAILDVLPTGDNLKQWGKSTDEKCSLCDGRGTLHHILNFCPVSLNQGRYTYRHNAIIHYLVQNLTKCATANSIAISIYADTKDKGINGGTIPHYIIPTQQKPDICIVEPSKKCVTLLELSVPFEPNIDKARSTKLERYASLVADINDMTDWHCDLVCLEVGSRGLITKDNKMQIKRVFNIVKEKRMNSIYADISLRANSASYAIFNARFCSVWIDSNMFL